MFLSNSKWNRRSIRLPGYDYTQPGAYFITICSYQFQHIFGSVIDDRACLSDFGRIIEEEWHKSPQVRPYLRMDDLSIMPNHFHGVVWITQATRTQTTPSLTNLAAFPIKREFRLVSGSLGAFVGGLKSAITSRINLARNLPSATPVWHRNYYEHIIRRTESLNRIRCYIRENPKRWTLDRYHPSPIGPDPEALAIWQMLCEEDEMELTEGIR